MFPPIGAQFEFLRVISAAGLGLGNEPLDRRLPRSEDSVSASVYSHVNAAVDVRRLGTWQAAP